MLVVPAYAKVNLALEVLSRRGDGYHDIASVVAGIDWHDLVGVQLIRGAGATVALRLTGPHAQSVPAGRDNLALVAGTALLQLSGSGFGLELWLDKRLPSGAGLGGGSADAAAVLRAGVAVLSEAGCRVSPTAVLGAAPAIGSDVPALLQGGTVIVGGRGENVRSIDAPPIHLAVALAGVSSTAAVYASLTPDELIGDGRVARLAERLTAGQPPSSGLLGSALEPAASRATPGLDEALMRLRAATSDTSWHLTGSGGAAFAVAEDATDAQRLAAAAKAVGYSARACRTLARTYNPAA